MNVPSEAEEDPEEEPEVDPEEEDVPEDELPVDESDESEESDESVELEDPEFRVLVDEDEDEEEPELDVVEWMDVAAVGSRALLEVYTPEKMPPVITEMVARPEKIRLRAFTRRTFRSGGILV
ncbi:hypothetical protein GCM10027027_21070 [Neomicrococcus lactis]